VRVQVEEETALLDVRFVALERPEPPRDIALRPLDLDDVGAEIGQQLGRVWPCDVVSQVQHHDVVEGLPARTIRCLHRLFPPLLRRPGFSWTIAGMRPLDWFPGIYQTQHTHASISPDGRRSNTWLTSNWAANSIARVERTLLPGEFALLAMLLDGPMHGYEMARAFEAPELQLICPIEQSSLYTYLRNLEARGFV